MSFYFYELHLVQGIIRSGADRKLTLRSHFTKRFYVVESMRLFE